MSEFIWIYVYTVITKVIAFGWVALGVAFAFAILYYVMSAAKADMTYSYPEGKEEHEVRKSKLLAFSKKKSVAAYIICLVAISSLFPSEDDVKTIIAGGLVWKASGSISDVDGVSELPENLVGAMNAFLIGIQGEASDKSQGL